MGDDAGKKGLNMLAWMAEQGVPDAALKFFLQKGVEYKLDDKNNLSSALMLRCVTGDTREFSNADLEGLDPRYPTTIKELLEHQLITMEAEGSSITRNKNFRVNLYEARDLAHAQGDDTAKDFGFNPHDMTQSASAYNDGQIMHDAIRALGNVKVSLDDDNHIMIHEHADFEGPFISVHENIRKAADFANQHDNAGMVNQVTSIFCPEDAQGRPTETSVPVTFTFSLDELSPEAQQALASMEERSHEDALSPDSAITIGSNDPERSR